MPRNSSALQIISIIHVAGERDCAQSRYLRYKIRCHERFRYLSAYYIVHQLRFHSISSPAFAVFSTPPCFSLICTRIGNPILPSFSLIDFATLGRPYLSAEWSRDARPICTAYLAVWRRIYLSPRSKGPDKTHSKQTINILG